MIEITITPSTVFSIKWKGAIIRHLLRKVFDEEIRTLKSNVKIYQSKTTLHTKRSDD
jgi:hypothetical protein